MSVEAIDSPHNWGVPNPKSQPIAIHAYRNPRTGSLSYQVIGTVRPGAQRKKHFSDEAEALAAQSDWELERTLAKACVRPKITRLTQSELAEAEAAVELLRGTGFSMLDGVRNLLRNPPPKRVEVTFSDGYQQFLEAKRDHLSERHCQNYESIGRRFTEFVGEKVFICDILSEQITSFLKSLGCGKKSWNTYRDDLGGFFTWFSGEPRCWVAEGQPLKAVERYRKRDTLPGIPERLSVPTCRELMGHLEADRPRWVSFFATALFLGIRPEGEMTKLAHAIQRDGLQKYLRGNTWCLTPEIAKDGRERRIPIPENVWRWYSVYPPTAESIRPGTRDEYTAIRRRFKIPHDGLRHTSLTACAVLNGLVTATKRHGNGAGVANDHYLSEMTHKEAEEFYAILPAKPEAKPQIGAAA
jgi:hypothetical protein